MYLQPFQKPHYNKISYQTGSKKRCFKNGLNNYIHSAAILYILLFCLPSTSFGWSIPFFGDIFSAHDDSNVKSHDEKFEKQPSITPTIYHEDTDLYPTYILRDASDKDVTVPTGNSSLLIAGTLILGGLVITSLFLYALDVYATSRIDDYLYTYYGPELYDRYTSVYDPNSNYAPYDTNGYYSATTASQYYGIKRSDERNTIGATARILRWIENTMEMFDVASELLQEEKCREHLICEAYQRKFMSGIMRLDHLSKLLEYFPIFQNAKSVSDNTMSKSGGCNHHYTGCAAISRAFQGIPSIARYRSNA